MATTFESMQTAGRVYADALLQLASERNELDAVEAQLADLAKLWHAEASFAQLMTSAAIDDDARGASLKKIFGGRVRELVLNLLLVLNRKGRTMILPAVCDAFARSLDLFRNRQRVFVSSAAPLNDEQRQKVRQVAQRLSGREPVLVERSDPDLLGGMVLQMGDRVIDASLCRRLEKLKRELHGRFDHHVHNAGHRFVVED